MNISFTLLIIFASLMVGIAWIPSKRFSGVKLKLTEKVQPTALKVAQPTDRGEIAVPEFLLSSKPDLSSIGTLLISQSVLVGIVLMTSFFTFRTYGLDFIQFDYDSMKTAAFIAAPVIVGGFTFDNLPWKVAKEIKRDTQSFTLRLFGRDSSLLTTMGWAFILAGSLIQIHNFIICTTQLSHQHDDGLQVRLHSLKNSFSAVWCLNRSQIFRILPSL